MLLYFLIICCICIVFSTLEELNWEFQHVVSEGKTPSEVTFSRSLFQYDKAIINRNMMTEAYSLNDPSSVRVI